MSWGGPESVDTNRPGSFPGRQRYIPVGGWVRGGQGTVDLDGHPTAFDGDGRIPQTASAQSRDRLPPRRPSMPYTLQFGCLRQWMSMLGSKLVYRRAMPFVHLSPVHGLNAPAPC